MPFPQIYNLALYCHLACAHLAASAMTTNPLTFHSLMNDSLIAQLQALLDQAVADGSELGLQLALYEHGQPVASLVAGFADAQRRRPIREDTLFPVFSVGKGVLATLAHRLVQRGTLSYATRVADVWPEFAAHGKQDVLFWHLLAHRAGLQHFPWPETDDQLADWDTCCRLVADMTPAWQPSTRHAYHAISFAWLVGNTLARADGRTLPQLLHDEITAPLHLQDELYFGTDMTMDTRIPDLVPRQGNLGELAAKMASPTIRHACIPSFNGCMSARAIARHYAALLDPVDGLDAPLLNPDTLDNAAHVRRLPDDQPLPGSWATHGLGYICHNASTDLIGHGGALGAEGFLVRSRHLAVGFTRNVQSPDIPRLPLRDAISDLLELPHRHW